MTPDRALTLLAIFFIMLLALGVWTLWLLTEDEHPGKSDPGLRWPQRVAPPDGPVVGRHSEPPGSGTP